MSVHLTEYATLLGFRALRLRDDMVVPDITASATRPQLIDEVKEWCDENLQGRYHLSWSDMMRSSTYTAVCLPYIAFEEDEDHIHFKMRWS